MIKNSLVALSVLALTGCLFSMEARYALDDKQFKTSGEYLQAVDAKMSNLSKSIEPLPKTVTQQKLLIAIPSQDAFVARVQPNIDKVATKSLLVPGGEKAGRDLIETNAKADYLGVKVLADAVIQRNIYPSVQVVNMPETTGNYAATADTDVLYLAITGGSAQWFFESAKRGRNPFAYDRTNPTPSVVTQKFVDAVQSQAALD
jgi:hypothetical protein